MSKRIRLIITCVFIACSTAFLPADSIFWIRLLGVGGWLVSLSYILWPRARGRCWWLTIYPEAGIPNSIHSSEGLAEMMVKERNNSRTRTDLKIMKVEEVK